jgi:hypothetical protein
VITGAFKAEKTLTKDTVPVDVDAVETMQLGGLAGVTALNGALAPQKRRVASQASGPNLHR